MKGKKSTLDAPPCITLAYRIKNLILHVKLKISGLSGTLCRVFGTCRMRCLLILCLPSIKGTYVLENTNTLHIEETFKISFANISSPHMPPLSRTLMLSCWWQSPAHLLIQNSNNDLYFFFILEILYDKRNYYFFLYFLCWKIYRPYIALRLSHALRSR